MFFSPIFLQRFVAPLSFLFTLPIFRDIALMRRTMGSRLKYSQRFVLPPFARPNLGLFAIFRHLPAGRQCRFGSSS